jgi:methionyl-tRNA formyltransferase
VAVAVRLTFLGNDRWSVPSLRALASSAHRIRVVTAAPKPAGRGNRLTPTPVADTARELELPLFEVETLRADPGRSLLASTEPDVLAVVAYGELLPRAVLELPKVAPVNLHFSLLPRLRGASPVQTALLLGEEETGVTTIVMDEGMDTGPIVLQRREPIHPDDDAGSLGERLAALGAHVLVESVELLASGAASPTPQVDSLATYAPRLAPRDRYLDWSKDAIDLVNRTRAFSPEPGTTTVFRGRDLKIVHAEIASASGEPGTLVEVDRDGFVVATGRAGFRPLELAPAGSGRMRSRDFVNGYRPTLGERLG